MNDSELSFIFEATAASKQTQVLLSAANLMSVSRAGAARWSVRGPKEKNKNSLLDFIVIPPGVLSLVMQHMPVNLGSLGAYTHISRLGIHKHADLQKAHAAFFKRLTKPEVKKLFTPTFIATLLAEFNKQYDIRSIKAVRRTYGRSRFATKPKLKTVKEPTTLAVSAANRNKIFHALLKQYMFYAVQMCLVLQKDFDKYGKAIIAHSMLGKTFAAKLPTGFKSSIKEGTKPIKLKAGVKLEKLKVSHFKGGKAQALVQALPDLYKTYIEGEQETKKEEDSTAKKAAQAKIVEMRKKVNAAYKKAYPTIKRAKGPTSRYATPSMLRPEYNVYRELRDKLSRMEIQFRKKFPKASSWTAKVKKRDSLLLKHKQLYEMVGDEVYDFLALNIPAIKLARNSPFLYKGIADKRQLEAEMGMHKRRLAVTKGQHRKAVVQSKINAIKEKIKDAKKKKSESGPQVKSWMIPYLGANVSIKMESKGGRKIAIDPALLGHRLVTRANTGKLKAGDLELNAVLNKTLLTTLTLGGISKIISACGGSVKAFKTVFADVVDEVKPKVFVAEFSESAIAALETETGKVTNSRLLRLNNITLAQQKDIEKTNAKDIKAWKPETEEIAKYVKSLSKSKDTVAHHYELRKSTAAELAANRKMINKFLSYSHGVQSLRVNKSWEVQPSKKLKALLANAKGKIQVIQDVFHGTYRQAGSIILARGFKVSGTQVTGRAMGDVLYVAPNADKSAQYMQEGGAFRRDSAVTGMIFMGDIIVSGEPKGHAGKSGGKSTGFDWTKIGSFKTEEIGLTNPNGQFIIRKAMIVTMDHKAGKRPTDAQQKSEKAVKKFKDRIDIVAYKKLK